MSNDLNVTLPAITLLTHRRWLLYTAYAVAGAGIALGIFAAAHIDNPFSFSFREGPAAPDPLLQGATPLATSCPASPARR